VNMIRSPRCSILIEYMLLTGDLAWHCTERKVEKSCSPSKCCAAARIRSTSSLRKTQPALPSSSGERTGLLYSTYWYMRERALKRAWKLSCASGLCATSVAQRTAIDGGKKVFTPRTQDDISRSS